MVLLLVFMQLTRDLFAIAKFLFLKIQAYPRVADTVQFTLKTRRAEFTAETASRARNTILAVYIFSVVVTFDLQAIYLVLGTMGLTVKFCGQRL